MVDADLKDAQDFFESIKNKEYLVMRNFDNLYQDIMCGGDIDILCNDKEDFLKTINATALSNKRICYNYSVNIAGHEVPIDLREIGDGYYDAKWEIEMLKRRIFNGSFYVMEPDDYKYSLLYHVVIQKNCISTQYRDKIAKLFNVKKLTKIGMWRKLNNYMIKMEYDYVEPIDEGVYVNKKNFVRLNTLKNICKGKKYEEK